MKNTAIKRSKKTLSPELGRGETFVCRDILRHVDTFYEIESARIEGELKRFPDAREQLDSPSAPVKEEVDTQLDDVFAAHSAIIQDESLKDKRKALP